MIKTGLAVYGKKETIDIAGSDDLEKIRSIGHEIAKIVDDIIINSESEINEVAEQAFKHTN